MNVSFSKLITFVDPVTDEEIELELDLEASFVNGGIGHFEMWGAKHYDSYPELDNLTCVNLDDFTPEQQK